jgi:hypothetical protein
MLNCICFYDRGAGRRVAPRLPPVAAMIQLILGKLPAERIAMNSQQMRGARLIPIHAIQHALDEALFELSDGLVE